MELVPKDYPFTRGLSKPGNKATWSRTEAGAKRLSSDLSVEYFSMPNTEHPSSETKRSQLEQKLREVDERLRSELLARGFDPAQDENLALTAPLAKLYMERENLRAALEDANRPEQPDEG